MTRILWHRPGTHDVGPAVVAMGVFDGVHLGHQALVGHAIEVARDRGVSAVVLTFDRDPDQVVTPDRAAPQLTTLDDKLALLGGLAPDAVLVVPFDETLATRTPVDFLDHVVLDACTPVCCVVGRDFRFGHAASGDVQALERFGAEAGFDVIAYQLLRRDGAPVTSSRIRQEVAAGRVGEAARLLGRPHRLHGTVVPGLARGRDLGFPTANLDVDARSALPAPGVYAAWVAVAGARHSAAVSVGLPPSFPDATCLLEAHLIDFEGDLYGAELTVEFVEHLRAQSAFPDAASLSAAIARDVTRARILLG